MADDARLVLVSRPASALPVETGGAATAAEAARASLGLPDAVFRQEGGEFACVELTVDPCGAGACLDWLHAQAGRFRCDWALTPKAGRRKRLLISDMDSTIIGQECLDELADFAGLKTEVSAITDRAMRGELDFAAALSARVAMLKGLELGALERCYSERVRLEPGARALVATMKAHGARCVLVSGGFGFFTRRVAALAGFDADRANALLDDGAVLTGEVARPILGREAKLAALLEECAALGLAPADAIALGDGANDLDMIRAAGLGVAYKAKPVVARETRARIEYTDLRAALLFQGYRESDFAADA